MSNKDFINEIKNILEKNKIPKTLTQKDLEKYYGFSISWQRKFRNRNSKGVESILPHYKLLGEIRYDRDEIEQWIRQHRVA